MKIALPEDLLETARSLRTRQTDAESLLWHLLRARRFMGLKFRRQYPMLPYVLDFYCEEIRLAVELDDGGHNRQGEALRDSARDQALRTQGIDVVRYWNHDLMQQTESVLEDLYLRALSRLRPSPGAVRHPLPAGEGWEEGT